MMVGLALEILGADVIVFSALAVLIAAGIVSPTEALHGFANPGMLAVGALFVVAGALRDTGAVSGVAHFIFGRTTNTLAAMARMVIPTCALSAFLNNTPVVAIFTPAVRDWLRRSGQSPSRFLIPLSYAAILGGTCTLIGTSTNLVVSGMLVDSGYAPFGMFELGRVGLPAAAVGCLLLMLLAPRLLPDRRDLVERLSDERREYIVEMAVEPTSPLVGKSVQDAGLRQLPGLFLVEIERGTRLVAPVEPHQVIAAGDRMVFTGIASTVADLRNFQGLVPVAEPHYSVFDQRGDRRLYEVVISPSSPLVGITVRAAGFRGRYDAAVIAVHRHGSRIVSKIGDIVLRAGDTLMVESHGTFAQNWRNSLDFYLVSELAGDERPRYEKARIAAVILLAMVILVTAGVMPLVSAAFAAVVALLFSRCISPNGARRSIDYSILLLIASAFGVAKALDKTGAASAVADLLIDSVERFGPVAVLAALYWVTSAFTAFVSNNAAAVIAFPIALASAQQLGCDPRPFAVAIALAASTSFATPMGYQTNLIVYGPGGYRFRDFVKAGLPMTAIVFVIAMLVIPRVWPF